MLPYTRGCDDIASKININHQHGVSQLDQACSLLVSLSYVGMLFLVFPNWQMYSDNFYYREAFNYPADNFFDFYRHFVWRTAGSEPFSVFLFFIFSKIISYELFIFIINIVLVYTITYYLRRNKHTWIIIIYFLITFYYLHVLSIGIHRFKVSVCYLSIMLIFFSTNKKIGLLSFVAPFFHGQSGIILAMALAKVTLAKKKFSFLSLTYFFIFLAGAYFAVKFSGIGDKFLSRLTFDWMSFAVAWVSAFIFFTVFVRPSFSDVTILIFVLCLILFLGGFRMNMILVGYFFWRVSRNNYKFGLLVLLMSPYMLSKNLYLYEHYATNLLN